MKVFFDTSVLIASVMATHFHHEASFKLLQKIHDKKMKGFVSAHSLAECYSVLSKYPLNPALSTDDVQQLIQANILNLFQMIEISVSDYQKVIKSMNEKSLRGGVIYDALIYQAAKKSKCEILYTWNIKDFQRIQDEGSLQILTP